MWLPMKSIWKLLPVPVMNASGYTYVTVLLYKVHLFSQMPFKVLVMAYKDFHGLETGHWRHQLSLNVSACLARSDKVGMLQIPALKLYYLMGLKWGVYSGVTPALWNSIPLEVWVTSIFPSFKSALTTCFFSLGARLGNISVRILLLVD